MVCRTGTISFDHLDKRFLWAYLLNLYHVVSALRTKTHRVLEIQQWESRAIDNLHTVLAVRGIDAYAIGDLYFRLSNKEHYRNNPRCNYAGDNSTDNGLY